MAHIDAFTRYLRKNGLREEVTLTSIVTKVKKRVKCMDMFGGSRAQDEINAFRRELASLKLSFIIAMNATNT
jgi:hypothetical protein